MSYINARIDGKDVVVWTRDSDHNLSVKRQPMPLYLYEIDEQSNTDIKSIFGDSVKKKTFSYKKDYDNYSKEGTFEADISPLHKFLSDHFHDSSNDPVHVGHYDIEVNFDLSEGKGYPTPENPFGEINSISLFDMNTYTYHLIMLYDDTNLMIYDNRDGLEVNNYHCSSEKQVLETFIEVISDIDVLTAWAGSTFDLSYVMARLQRLYGQRGLTMLCRHGIMAKSHEAVDKFGNEFIKYTLAGRVHLDLLEVYKKFTFGERESYALDSVAENELDENKLEYKGDLGELYRTDPQTFFDYSLHDVRLMKMLDEKMNLVKLLISMAREATVNFDEMMGSIKYIEMAIRNYCHFTRSEPLVLPNKPEVEKSEKFPGAIVLDSKVGVYDWVMTVDLSALYPSTIRSLNISPETHSYQCTGGYEDFVKVVEQSDETVHVEDIKVGGVIPIAAYKLKEFIVEENLSISANGSLFDNTYSGIVSEVLELWANRRNEHKANMKSIQKQMNRLNRDSPELDALQDEYEKEDMLNQQQKLNANSTFGAIANAYCRLFTLDCAKSITLTGREISKHQMVTADKLINEVK